MNFVFNIFKPLKSFQSKLTLFLSITRGLFWIFSYKNPTYSPTIPIENNNIENKKNNPIIIGAIPIVNVFQNTNLSIKKTIAENRLITENISPAIVAILKGTFEWLTIPSMPKSYNK